MTLGEGSGRSESASSEKHLWISVQEVTQERAVSGNPEDRKLDEGRRIYSCHREGSRRGRIEGAVKAEITRRDPWVVGWDSLWQLEPQVEECSQPCLLVFSLFFFLPQSLLSFLF